MFDSKVSKSKAYAGEIKGLLVGNPIRLNRGLEGNWSFDIGERFVVRTDIWRLVGAKRIIVTSEDDGHQFGLPAPLDAEAEANKALSDYKVSDVDLDIGTGDLAIHVGDALKLQVWTTSSGYESWQLYRDNEFFGAIGSEGLR
ncbi:MAG: hypothetical protein AAF697_10655 [Pseudomonadota bacterium]